MRHKGLIPPRTPARKPQPSSHTLKTGFTVSTPDINQLMEEDSSDEVRCRTHFQLCDWKRISKADANRLQAMTLCWCFCLTGTIGYHWHVIFTKNAGRARRGNPFQPTSPSWIRFEQIFHLQQEQQLWMAFHRRKKRQHSSVSHGELSS